MPSRIFLSVLSASAVAILLLLCCVIAQLVVLDFGIAFDAICNGPQKAHTPGSMVESEPCHDDGGGGGGG